MLAESTEDTHKILYVTSNKIKLRVATEVCKEFGIGFEPADFTAPEIQSEDGEPVARDKAEKAFASFKRPLVISDDSWYIPGLKGFPGPYMKSMNHWFSAEDWLHLTSQLKDRRIILRQVVVYQDENGQHVFSTDIESLLLPEIRQRCEIPHLSIVSFDGGATSGAQNVNNNKSSIFEADRRTSWHDFAEWYVTVYS